MGAVKVGWIVKVAVYDEAYGKVFRYGHDGEIGNFFLCEEFEVAHGQGFALLTDVMKEVGRDGYKSSTRRLLALAYRLEIVAISPQMEFSITR